MIPKSLAIAYWGEVGQLTLLWVVLLPLLEPLGVGVQEVDQGELGEGGEGEEEADENVDIKGRGVANL